MHLNTLDIQQKYGPPPHFAATLKCLKLTNVLVSNCTMFFTGLSPHFCQRSRTLPSSSPSPKRQAEPNKQTDKQEQERIKTNKQTKSIYKQAEELDPPPCNSPDLKGKAGPNKQTRTTKNTKQTDYQTNKSTKTKKQWSQTILCISPSLKRQAEPYCGLTTVIEISGEIA